MEPILKAYIKEAIQVEKSSPSFAAGDWRAWSSLVCAVADLPAPELLEDVRKAYADGFLLSVDDAGRVGALRFQDGAGVFCRATEPDHLPLRRSSN